eukprot:TRINITY_DN3688_c0_g1_i1.p1 TRINITY_DN3688_c0_g1~~TRINITY_DN3688_c0_g1_i1.p1  ORF type:complete len:224 (+),score=58.21 TRINITY_DN3688_c0_g1_i1:186-857(+)
MADRDRVYIAGFGSLMSLTSALTTFPDLEDFHPARVHGYRRVFNHTAEVFCTFGIANVETKETSSVSAVPREGSSIVVALFSIPRSSLEAFYNREPEFVIKDVVPHDLESDEPMPQKVAKMCTASDDERYISARYGGSREAFLAKIGQWGLERIWDPHNLLPCRVYLRHCVLAAKRFHEEAHRSFLRDSFLGDGRTIGEYLEENADILDEVPPEVVAKRYGGV